MSVDQLLHWLYDTPFSAVMRESVWAEPLFETIHVLALTLFLGFVLLLDLRLLDLVMRRKRVSEIFRQLNPWLFTGFGVMIATGVLLFCADPVAFYSTMFFKVKMIMIVLAGLNVLTFNATLGRRMGEWDSAPRTPWQVKLSGIVSLLLWLSIVAAGRSIAYVLPAP